MIYLILAMYGHFCDFRDFQLQLHYIMQYSFAILWYSIGILQYSLGILWYSVVFCSILQYSAVFCGIHL